LNASAMPILSGSAVASVTFWRAPQVAWSARIASGAACVRVRSKVLRKPKATSRRTTSGQSRGWRCVRTSKFDEHIVIVLHTLNRRRIAVFDEFGCFSRGSVDVLVSYFGLRSTLFRHVAECFRASFFGIRAGFVAGVSVFISMRYFSLGRFVLGVSGRDCPERWFDVSRSQLAEQIPARAAQPQAVELEVALEMGEPWSRSAKGTSRAFLEFRGFLGSAGRISGTVGMCASAREPALIDDQIFVADWPALEIALQIRACRRVTRLRGQRRAGDMRRHAMMRHAAPRMVLRAGCGNQTSPA